MTFTVRRIPSRRIREGDEGIDVGGNWHRSGVGHAPRVAVRVVHPSSAEREKEAQKRPINSPSRIKFVPVDLDTFFYATFIQEARYIYT